MRITAKGRYAVTAMLDLAMHGFNKPITAAELAQRHGISTSFLERLAVQLRSKGLLKSVRGPKGGYLLAKSAEEINIAQIVAAVDEKIDTTNCDGKANCMQGTTCLTHHIWDTLNDKIMLYLTTTTLGSLVEKPELQKIAIRQIQSTI